MRKLFYTTGSPFARAARIVMAELGLDFERDETFTTPSVEYRLKSTPTLQVPALFDGDLRLWDSDVIIDYLFATYRTGAPNGGDFPLAKHYHRPDHHWPDRLLAATILTFGESTATVSQMRWSGIALQDNAHTARCATRNQHLLDWFEASLRREGSGFFDGALSAQDIMLAAWCQFIDRRPIGLTWDAENRPKLRALIARLEQRPSFQNEPALWWEPGVTYGSAEEIAWARGKTNLQGLSFAEWKQANG